MSVDFDLAAVHVIETHQKFYHGGLARTCGAYNGNLLSVLHIRRKIMDDHFVGIIAERHMFKLHVSFQIPDIRRIFHSLILLRLFQELKHSLRSGRGRLKQVRHLGDLLDRLGKITDILEKGLYISDFDGSPDGEYSAQQSNHHIPQISHKLHDRHHHSGEKLRFPGGFVKFPVVFLKFRHHVLFLIENFHHIVAAVVFFDLTVDFSQIALLVAEIFLGSFHHKTDDHHRHRQDQKRRQRHPHIDGKHHHQHADQRRHRSDQLRHALVQTHLQSVHIVRHSGKDLAVSPALKIVQRHSVDLPGNIFPQIISDVVGDPRHHKSLDKREQGAYQIESHNPQKDHSDLMKINSSRAVHFRHQSVKKLRGGFSQNLGSYDIKHGSRHRKNKHQYETELISSHIAEQLRHGASEVAGFLSRTHASSAVAHPAAGHSSLLTHWPIPPLITATSRSACKPHSSSSVPCESPAPPFCRRPAQGSDPRSESC